MEFQLQEDSSNIEKEVCAMEILYSCIDDTLFRFSNWNCLRSDLEMLPCKCVKS